MLLYSTKNRNHIVDLKEAVFGGLPPDNGLYMPVEIPVLSKMVSSLEDHTFSEIGIEICKALFQGAIPDADVIKIVEKSINFPAPVINLDEKINILELFHGPSLAFKDFGARFMAQLMSHLNKEEDEKLTILVATSGDTGGAVAAGFYKTPGIEVVILYPSGKVSPLQEKQLTTLGENVRAIEIKGTFDDCQALVKKAFLDQELRSELRLSSANSINIARLIPQSFYYFEAFKQLNNKNKEVVFVIPSGNFGNLTAGLFARKMGLPVHRFIAATNINSVVPRYLASKKYETRPSIRTLSNAMDVGAPSNFMRMVDLFSEEKGKGLASDMGVWNKMNALIKGYSLSDEATIEAVKEVRTKYNYTIEPHGAVGYLALKEYLRMNNDAVGVVLETAHSSKFKEDMESFLGVGAIEVPERLAILANKKKESVAMGVEYNSFKEWLMGNVLQDVPRGTS